MHNKLNNDNASSMKLVEGRQTFIFSWMMELSEDSRTNSESCSYNTKNKNHKR